MMTIMMRNLVLIGAILLVSASATVCEFWKSKNPVSVLNKYLVENVANDGFVDNMKAIVKYKPGPKDEQVEQLVSLLTNLGRKFDPEQFCTGSNLKTLRETIEAVYNYDTESFREPKLKRRLNYLLYKYFSYAWITCNKFYAEKFKKPHERLVKLGLGGYVWNGVYGMHSLHAYDYVSTFLPKFNDEYALMGAIRMSQGKWEPSKKELKEVLGKEMERLSLDDAKKKVSELLYEPCKVLLNDAEAQSIFDLITDLGSAWILLDRPNKSWMSLLWASHNVFCKWVIGKSEDQLAKMIR